MVITLLRGSVYCNFVALSRTSGSTPTHTRGPEQGACGFYILGPDLVCASDALSQGVLRVVSEYTSALEVTGCDALSYEKSDVAWDTAQDSPWRPRPVTTPAAAPGHAGRIHARVRGSLHVLKANANLLSLPAHTQPWPRTRRRPGGDQEARSGKATDRSLGIGSDTAEGQGRRR
uniref:Uncharacterized protein n=1 Tax=Knipowitschia caucasica TaxID=637954 RepID=A0AAV2L8P1_KNICA